MKKCCFVKFLRKNNIISGGFEYIVVKNIQPMDDHSELVSSFHVHQKVDLVNFDDIDSNTNLIIAFDVTDTTELFKNKLKLFIDSVNCKSLFFDFSTYDEQEIAEYNFDEIEELTNKPCYFISKNLLQNRDNHLYFEVLFYHHINAHSEVPRNLAAYIKIKDSQINFWPKFKASYYPGHIRFHKVKFLEFLYKNNLLDEIIWSSTGIDFDKPIFREFVPIEYDEEFNSFEILKHIPRRIDFDLANREQYAASGGQINLLTYLDTSFEIVPETRFYDVSGAAGAKKTEKTWNNISEKTMKPTMLSQPFILIAKPNTIKLLEERGLNYKFDFWNYSYDTISTAEERMDEIKKFTLNVMKMSKNELKEFNRDYFHFSKGNYNILLKDVYIKSINDIWNKF
jgi:hypothetical protein